MSGEPEIKEKFWKAAYRSDGQVEIESNDITVFDLWALASYMKMQADELYINKQAIERMKQSSGLTVAGQMPRKPGKVTPIR